MQTTIGELCSQKRLLNPRSFGIMALWVMLALIALLLVFATIFGSQVSTDALKNFVLRAAFVNCTRTQASHMDMHLRDKMFRNLFPISLLTSLDLGKSTFQTLATLKFML